MRLMMILTTMALLAFPVWAQDEALPWQLTVTGQIEALRDGEPEIALSFAGQSFRQVYDDPERFVADIGRIGYLPIIESQSHRFGEYRQIEPDFVIQVVELLDAERVGWEALYQLRNEPDEGWRVHGVLLRRIPGLNI
ncbi:MAG: DUF4864 domain-containing protein [Devosia sp.]|uniref:DUF4864 domain-containing protein n=1 Tax=Devosia sp. TaxID=1871048 RepID=UPI0024CB76EF|nr:DUF4864 domain-containing protein [Devosia sp.]UYO00973.1 MAG: DUF4864 domain-containing protein [Devosia sp.]